VVNNKGFVGIGTTTPFAQFSIFAASSTQFQNPTTLFAIGSSTAAFATTTLFSIDNRGVITSNAAATSTFAAGIQATYLNLTGSIATSTAANGFNITSGCFAINGTCLSTGGSSFAYPWTLGNSFGATYSTTTKPLSGIVSEIKITPI
jgi:hypothetical protein